MRFGSRLTTLELTPHSDSSFPNCGHDIFPKVWRIVLDAPSFCVTLEKVFRINPNKLFNLEGICSNIKNVVIRKSAVCITDYIHN